MNIFNRFKLVFSNNFDEWRKAFLRGDDVGDYSTMNVDSEMAMKYSAVFACVRVLSETVASLPIGVYKKNENGDKEDARDLDIYDVLHDKPNDEMTPFNFKEAMMTSLCLGGNAYALKLTNSRNDVKGLYPLDWQKVTMRREDGVLIYVVKKGLIETKYTRKEIFHIPGLSLDGIDGLTPISYAAKAIELGLTYEAFCNNFYKNGANSTMLLKHPKTMSEPAFNRLKQSFTERQAGIANTNKPIIVEEGIDVTQLSIHPVDAQLLESKNFQIEDICRIYRVPQHLVNKLDRSTNNNIEHQSLEFVMYTMMPWFKRIEENINLQILTKSERKQGYFVEFKVDAILRGDVVSRSQAYATGRQWGYLSVNDILKMENRNSIGPDGDIYLQPMNMVKAGIPTAVETVQPEPETVEEPAEE